MMESPLPYDDQDDEMKYQFYQLLGAIFSINSNSSEDDVRALNERVQREVVAKPILAKIVNLCYTSLLLLACVIDNELFHPAIKCLIEANPSALLWEIHSDIGKKVIHRIAGHSTHCVLMPWIATDYQWVLDHEICLERPPVFALLYQYTHRREETGCTAAIIRQFFEAYPQGFMQEYEDGNTPLHFIVEGSAECELDLLKWMAERCSSNMLRKDSSGWTPLHRACISLADNPGDNSSEICKYLMKQCPESVRIPNNDKWLPIHYLVRYCQHRAAKEVVVSLLREYPESYDMATSLIITNMVPRTVPFIQRVKLLLDEERELEKNIAYLKEVSGVFRDAVDDTKTPISLASSTCDAFVNWATVTSVQRLEAKIEQIETQLQHECNAD